MEEKTKEADAYAEKEASGSAGEIPVKEVPKAGGGKKHSVKGLIKDMWPAYLIEIFVIIIGISITLALEEWRDHSKEGQLEAIYRKNLLADIEVDLRYLKYTSERTQQIIDKGEEMLRFINDPSEKSISAGQAGAYLQKILERPKFLSSDATFSDLKNSGNLHLIKDPQLKNLLFAYYGLAQNIKEVQDAEQQATIVIAGPYFLKRLPLGDIGNKNPTLTDKGWQALVNDVEFRNNVVLRVENRKELLGGYQRADALVHQVKTALSAGE